eukprot:NODE_6455_length_1671_cov_2.568005.p2 GENE.NODE_6455_length_1671_cov_2.568005~~NODE_6455_length_1671_cov_2.568005.p2  ORF type:complete len:265 (-),score=85.23 NODE_6455_length_1671_cov_2.568005:117-911(-)
MLPALFYAANNIIYFQFIAALELATFAIYREMQVVWAALLWYGTFRINLGWKRWLALVTILISCTIMKVAPGQAVGITNHQLFLGLLSPLVSTAASVSNEKAIKCTDLDINTQNAMLYTFCAIFALIYLAVVRTERFASPALFFEGFSIGCFKVLVLQGILGLVISRILKRANAMLKQVLTAFRGPCLVLLMLTVFQVRPTTLQGCMSGLTAIAAIFYMMQGSMPSEAQKQPEAEVATGSDQRSPHLDDSSPKQMATATTSKFV